MRPSSATVAAACVLVVAFALRVAGLDFGLPLAEARPDELTIAYQAMKFGTGDLNPHSFNYPSLHKYVTFGLFGFWYVVGRIAGFYASQQEFLKDFFDGAVDFRLLMRAWSAAAGTLGVAMLLRAPGGAWSAALLAVAMLHVRDSHFGVTDVTMVTLATGAVLASLALLRSGRPRDLWVAAVLAGLATSTKYNAGLLCLPLALAAWRSPGGGPSRVALAGLGMVGAFFAGTPYALLDARQFWTDFSYELTHLSTGHYVDIGNGWVHHLWTLALTQGPPFLVAAGLGAVLHLRRDRWEAAVLYAFPLVYWLAIGRGETAFFRYILPVVPFLCVAVGDALARLASPAGRTVGLVALGLWPAWGSLQVDRLFLAGDTRDAMGRFIEANVPSGARIVHAGTYTGAPMLQRNVVNQTREYEAKRGRADSAGFRKPDDLSWYNADRPMYDVVFVEKAGIDFASRLPVDEVLAEPPEWLLVEEYFLVHYSAVPDPVKDLAARRYVRVHSEAAFEGPVAGVFDQQDALYLPAAGFTGFTRMGPTLHLYRRQDP